MAQVPAGPPEDWQLLAFIRARLDDRERTQSNPDEQWHATGCDAVLTRWRSDVGPCDCGVPAGVLAEVEATRALLADLLEERHDVNEGDPWYTCIAATEEADGGESCDDERRGGPCDCGRDLRLTRRLRLLAQPDADHPDYLPQWRPEGR